MADAELWRDRNKVFVAGLPTYVGDDELYEKFRPFGEMHQSKVVLDAKTGRSRGFGFVTFHEYVNALDAVEKLDQSKWDKRTLNVRFLQPKSGDKAQAQPDQTRARPAKIVGPRPEGCTTVYVGNLAYDITEEVLRKVFAKCGSVRAVRFAEHIQTKEFRGFGYVQFHEGEPCEAAVQLDGQVVMGRPMNVDYGARDEGYTAARAELQKKLKKGVCHKFQTGECTRGDDCKFAHIMQGQDAEELIQPAASSVIAPGAAITGGQAHPAAEETAAPSDAPVCINFQKGKCKRGSACRFQHLGASGDDSTGNGDANEAAADVVEEAPEAPEEEPTQADENAPVCQNYQKGKCKRGSACRFRHVAASGEQEDEPAASSYEWKAPVRVELPAAAVAEVAICRNFQRGNCHRGASCRFAHTGGSAANASAVSGGGAGGAVDEVSEYQKRFQSVCYNWQRSGSCVRGDSCPFQHEGFSGAGEVDGGDAGEQEEADVDDEAEEQPKKKEKKEKKKKRRHAEAEVEDETEESPDRKKKKKDKKAKKEKHKKSKHRHDDDDDE